MALALGNPVEHLRNQVLRNSILEHKPDLVEYLFLSETKQIIKKSKKKVLELRFSSLLGLFLVSLQHFRCAAKVLSNRSKPGVIPQKSFASFDTFFPYSDVCLQITEHPLLDMYLRRFRTDFLWLLKKPLTTYPDSETL